MKDLGDLSPEMAWICKGKSITSLLAAQAPTHTLMYADKRRVERLLLNIPAGAHWNMTEKGSTQ